MYEQALAAAAMIPSTGRLAGVPYLVKGLIAEVAGAPFSEGSRFLRGHVSHVDSELVLRLRRAGLVVWTGPTRRSSGWRQRVSRSCTARPATRGIRPGRPADPVAARPQITSTVMEPLRALERGGPTVAYAGVVANITGSPAMSVPLWWNTSGGSGPSGAASACCRGDDAWAGPRRICLARRRSRRHAAELYVGCAARCRTSYSTRMGGRSSIPCMVRG